MKIKIGQPGTQEEMLKKIKQTFSITRQLATLEPNILKMANYPIILMQMADTKKSKH